MWWRLVENEWCYSKHLFEKLAAFWLNKVCFRIIKQIYSGSKIRSQKPAKTLQKRWISVFGLQFFNTKTKLFFLFLFHCQPNKMGGKWAIKQETFPIRREIRYCWVSRVLKTFSRFCGGGGVSLCGESENVGWSFGVIERMDRIHWVSHKASPTWLREQTTNRVEQN